MGLKIHNITTEEWVQYHFLVLEVFINLRTSEGYTASSDTTPMTNVLGHTAVSALTITRSVWRRYSDFKGARAVKGIRKMSESKIEDVVISILNRLCETNILRSYISNDVREGNKYYIGCSASVFIEFLDSLCCVLWGMLRVSALETGISATDEFVLRELPLINRGVYTYLLSDEERYLIYRVIRARRQGANTTRLGEIMFGERWGARYSREVRYGEGITDETPYEVATLDSGMTLEDEQEMIEDDSFGGDDSLANNLDVSGRKRGRTLGEHAIGVDGLDLPSAKIKVRKLFIVGQFD